jgi:hypothetical protein
MVSINNDWVQSEAAPLVIDGQSFDPHLQMIAYDRQTNQFSTIPRDHPSQFAVAGQRMIQIISTRTGPHTLLPPEFDPTLIHGNSMFSRLVARPYCWTPTGDRLIQIVPTQLGEFPSENRSTGPDYKIFVRDLASNSLSTYSLDHQTARNAINSVWGDAR